MVLNEKAGAVGTALGGPPSPTVLGGWPPISKYARWPLIFTEVFAVPPFRSLSRWTGEEREGFIYNCPSKAVDV